MLFTDITFFRHEPTKISNIDEMGDIALEVTRFILSCEKQCLILVLGQVFYDELADCFDADNKLKEDAPQSITDLILGKEYTVECPYQGTVKKKWKGIVQKDTFNFNNTEVKIKTSFIADYIYYFYLLENRNTTTGVGQVKLSAENANGLSNFYKRIDSYNRFRAKVVGGRKNETSMYEFLRDHKEDYPNWKPAHIEPMYKY